MAYDSTIPALGNLISNDIPAMQENFSLLESAQVVDEGSTNDGDYIRYENGWQVIVRETYIPSSEISVDNTLSFDLPQSFSEVFAGSFSLETTFWGTGGSEREDAAKTLNGLLFSAGDSAIRFRFYDVSYDSSEDLPVQIVAIGRWK